MANRNNTGRTKKTHNYRPYDASNSFVKRITAKVSEILPQSTSWVSRFFTTSPTLNVRERVELDEEEEDEEERQPPSKRLCFSQSETNDYSHQNNINRLGDLERDSGEISPIACSRVVASNEDLSLPGPSGLHLRHFPTSSTPAIRPPPVMAPTVNLRDKGQQERERISQQQQQRDDASDESESTSGCSSLVPGSHPRQEPPTPTTPPSNLQSAFSSSRIGSMRRLSTSAATNTSLNRTSLNLSTSSQPTFDSYVFNNPLNRSGIRKRLLGDESCFYPGNTTFGGSSARTLSPAESPRIVTIRPSPTKQVQQDTIGASALKILRALEQFSTPVLDAKRMPVRRPGVGNEKGKRKPAQPYEELIFPSMPDLLRVKRRERELRATERSQEMAVSPVPATSSPSTSKASPRPPSPSPQYSLRIDNPREKHTGSIKVRDKDKDYESEQVPTVNLPNDVKLQLSSLPKFDILPGSGKNTVSLKHSASSTNEPPSSPSLSAPPLSSKSPPFKFSLPQVPNITYSKAETVSLPVNTFKFSEPLEPLKLQKRSDSSEPMSLTSDKPLPPQLQMKNPSPVLRLKRKSIPKPEETSHFNIPSVNKTSSLIGVQELKNAENLKSSITSASTPRISSQKCDSSEKPSVSVESISRPDESWSCLKCYLKNASSDEKCKSCGVKKGENPSTYKGFGGFTKPKDTWECKECFVNNKKSVDVCVACSTAKVKKSDAKTASFKFVNSSEPKVNDVGASTTSLFNSVKPTAGSWECDTCLVKNKKDDLKCVACSSNKPGVTPEEKPKPTFSFGIPPSISSSQVNAFSLPNAGSIPAQQFTFGIPPNNSNSPKSGSATSIGMVNKVNENVSSSSNAVSSSVSSTVPLVNSIKKAAGSWECSTCLVQNKKESTSCVACSTTKPGCNVVEKPKETFTLVTFGIPTASAVSSTNNALTNTATISTVPSSLSSSQPVFTFGGSANLEKDMSKTTPIVKDAPKTTSLFNFSKTNDTSNTNNEIKPFSFMNSEQTKEKSENKAPANSNLFTFGNTISKDNKTAEMNDDHDNRPAKKRVSFGNPLASEKTNDENAVVKFGAIVSSTPSEATPSATFTFTPFDSGSKELSAPANSFFTFGSSEASKPNSVVPMSFGRSSDSSAAPNSDKEFGGFKMPDTETKPFTFMTNSQTTAPSGGFAFNSTSQTPVFGSQINESKPKSIFFGQQQPSPAAPLFSQSQEPKPGLFSQAQEPKPGLFNQPQEQKPGLFNQSQEQKPVLFSQSQEQKPGLFSQTQEQKPGLFSQSHEHKPGIFGQPQEQKSGMFNQSQEQKPGLFSQTQEQKPFVFNAPTPTPAQSLFSVPASPSLPSSTGLGVGGPSGGFNFSDPNIKPTFNFTSGATPSFNAAPSSVVSERKMKRGIRRVSAHR